MKCENQEIADRLVPYVEGALAEAERANVIDHLRNCPSCREEARALREAIRGLRATFEAGYRPSLAPHPLPEELSSYAVEPETLPEARLQALALHLLECDDCEAEVGLLRDMERDLEGRVPTGAGPLVLPRALREEIEQGFQVGPSRREPAEGSSELPFLERVSFLLSRFNWRPVLATGLAAVVLTLGFLFAFSGPREEVALQAPGAAPQGAPPPAAEKAAAPRAAAPGEVALPVPAGQAEAAARLLDQGRIPYENRDGRLVLAAGDLERARQLLKPLESQVALADRSAPGGGASPSPLAPSPEARDEETKKGDQGQKAEEATPTPSPEPSPEPVPSPVATTPSPAAPRPQPSRVAVPRPSKPASTPAGRVSTPAPAPTRLAASGEAAPTPHVLALGGGEGISRSAGPAPADLANEAFEAAPPPTPGSPAQSSAPRLSEARGSAKSVTLAPPPAAAPAPGRAGSLEPQARQVAPEASVSVEDADDGSVRVVVRTRRALTAQEEDGLRSRLRRDLRLQPTDTIVIRQP